MALESATYINGLVATNPTSTDSVSQGDDHIRVIKSTLLATFPNVTGAMTATHTALNNAATLCAAATDANTASTIVKRTSGSVINATTFVGNLTGNVTGNLTGAVTGNASTATTAAAWTTARSITLTGDVTGTVTGVDGSGNVSITTTVESTTSATNTIAISSVTGLQSALNGKLATTANAATASAWASNMTLTFGGDLSGSVAFNGSAGVTASVQVADNSHSHTIANITNLQTTLDSKLGSTATAANSDKIDGYHISTASSGTDSSTIYFRT